MSGMTYGTILMILLRTKTPKSELLTTVLCCLLKNKYSKIETIVGAIVSCASLCME